MAATITKPPARCTTHRSHYEAGCTPCRTRSNWYNKRLRAHRRAGRWQPMVNIVDVRTHITHLRDAGMILTDIAKAAGISDGYLNAIIYDPRRKKLNPTIGGILLDLKPQPSEQKLIDPTGTRRRLRALQAAGWPMYAIAERIGSHESLPSKWAASPTITRHTADRVKHLYDELADQAGPSPITARRAQSRGWVDCYHWPDDTIDDPTAEPFYGTDAAEQDAQDRRTAVARLTAEGLSADAIAERLRIDTRSVQRHRAAIRQTAATDQVAA